MAITSKFYLSVCHAAAYAVISMQTAWLKCYYPVEFMAALMTSVIDNSTKAAEYLYHCKEMGIKVLPPDINEGSGEFTAENGKVRYGLYAIKALGRQVIDRILEERQIGGPYRTLQDFIERTAEREVNKRAIENLIKAGACDSLDGNRKQMTLVYTAIVDQVVHNKKNSMAGQMSLFDLVSDDEKKDFGVKYPNVEEFDRETALGFEKEVLGIYLSGHPLEAYMDKMKKNITAQTADFIRDEETGEARVKEGEKVVIGGMITEKTIKYTRNNKTMAFLTVEDLTGTVEVIVFPMDYEKNQANLIPDAKVFVSGRVSLEDEQNGKVICEKVVPFDETAKEVWVQFATKNDYMLKQRQLSALLRDSDGKDEVVIYVANPKAIKRLGASMTVCADALLKRKLVDFLGDDNVRVVEKKARF